MTPREAHELGTAEVARLQGEIERLQGALGLTGSIAEAGGALRANPEFRPASPQQLMAAYGRAQARVALRLPGLFARPLTTRLEIRALEPHRALSAPGVAYRAPSVEDKRAGVLYVDTRELASRPTYLAAAQYLEQGVPGRHYQATIAQETPSLPRLRRFGLIESFDDGWAVYAATLGRELGMYDEDVFSQFGALSMELARAALIVVDTGLHLHDWTRERAIEYLRSQTALSPADVENAVDRCIAEPAVALAGPIGARRIAALRRKAAQQFGTRFDVRQFHEQVVGGGAMPMPTLELKINRWIATQK